MFRVIIEQKDNKGKEEPIIDLQCTTETFQQLLGRYMLKYGSPLESELEGGINEFQFYKDNGNGAHLFVNVQYARVEKSKKMVVIGPQRITPPAIVKPSPIVEGPLEGTLKELFDSNLIERA